MSCRDDDNQVMEIVDSSTTTFEAEGKELTLYVTQLLFFGNFQALHSGHNGIFEYFQFSFLLVRMKYLDITKYLRSIWIEFEEFYSKES